MPRARLPLGRNQPLVPAASIAGRALVTVIAIMTFLAGLTAGTAQLVADASAGWRSSVSREVTIQVRPVARPGYRGRCRQGRGDGARVARRRRRQGLQQGRIRAAAGALAGHRAQFRRAACAPHRRAEADRASVRISTRCARACPRRCAAPARRPSALGRAAGRHGAIRFVVLGMAIVGAGHRGDRLGRGLRHARRDGRQPRDRGGPAFRRRDRRLHRPAVPAAFPAARPARRRDRGRLRRWCSSCLPACSPRRSSRRLAARRSRRCSARSRIGFGGFSAIVAIAGLVAIVTAIVSRVTVRKTLRELG